MERRKGRETGEDGRGKGGKIVIIEREEEERDERD